MDMNKIFYFIMFGMIITFFIPAEVLSQPPPGTKTPIITHSYAIDKGRYGQTWKIYLEAQDPDGDLAKIASTVDQIGYCCYSTDYIPIKPPFQTHLKGYIRLNTFSSRTSFIRAGTQITLKVSIFDHAGNESNRVVFPLEFVIGGEPAPKPPAPFDQGDIPLLGNIMIDLVEPSLMEPTPGHK